jgi:dihydroorotase
MPDIELIIDNVVWKGEPHTLLVSGGRIAGLVHRGAAPGTLTAPRVEGNGCLLLPSLIDAHVHLREPGQEYKEDIASGLTAAAGGGFGTVMPMANTSPVNDTAAVTELMLERAALSNPKGPRLRPVGALTRGLAGKELAPMAELAQAGCVAFSNDGVPVANNEVFRRAVEYASDLGLKVIDHCEEPGLANGGVMNEGAVSAKLGLKGQPTTAEAIQVARDILLAAYLDQPIHLAHISCRESIELIAWAKRKSVPVTAETCPHYLLWDETQVEGYNTLAKVNPPLRTRDDVLAVRQALRTGVLDILVTDHAPHADFEKEVPFDQAPNGISGLDTALSLTWALVGRKVLSQEDLLRTWCYAPARIFGLDSNGFSPGDRADFLLFDPAAAWKVSPMRMRSKGKNSLCLGKTLRGKVRSHYLDGELIFSQ